MSQSGVFVVSLDFELFWGVRDKRSINSYGDALSATHVVVPRMVNLFNEYGVNATFATVGFLFAETKNDILAYSPVLKPNYRDANLSPYTDNFFQVNEDNTQDPYHFGFELIKNILAHPQHEIGSHAFSHFYCQEEGQTIHDFEADLKAAISIAANKGVIVESLVFPRNQFSEDYLEICKDHGIKAFRGNEKVWFHKPESEKYKINKKNSSHPRLLCKHFRKALLRFKRIRQKRTLQCTSE